MDLHIKILTVVIVIMVFIFAAKLLFNLKYNRKLDAISSIAIASLLGMSATIIAYGVLHDMLILEEKTDFVFLDKNRWTIFSALIAAPTLLLTWYWRENHKRKNEETDKKNVIIAQKNMATAIENQKVANEQYKLANKNHEIEISGQISNRFSKGVEQLASDKIEIKLGAIYSLEQIAIESTPYYRKILKILEAFIRENSKKRTKKQVQVQARIFPFTKISREDTTDVTKIDTDLQAALSVLIDIHDSEDEERIDLSDIVFVSKDLKGFAFQNMNFTKANMAGADLTDVNLTEATLIYADLSGANLTRAYLAGANLARTNLQRANLSRAHMEKAYLEHSKLNMAILTRAKFRKANLTKASMVMVDLTETNMLKAELQRVNLFDSDMTMVNLREADLTEANLDQAYMYKSQMVKAILFKATLKHANLTEANFNNATLTEADLTKATLYGADFTKANLTGANLTKANLIGANLQEADLRNANLSEIKIMKSGGIFLTNDDLKEAKYNEKTIFPEGFDPKKYGMIFFSETETDQAGDK